MIIAAYRLDLSLTSCLCYYDLEFIESRTKMGAIPRMI